MSGPRFGPPSHWQADAPAPTWAPLEGDRDADVLVLGAGLAGLGVARALADRGQKALVLDAGGPGAGASGRNAGFVLRTHVTAFPALRARVGDTVARALLWLGEDTRRRIQPSAGYRGRGSLMLAATDTEAAALVTAGRALRELDVRAEEAPLPAGVRGYTTALRLPDDGEVHPMRLLGALCVGLEGRLARIDRIDPAASVVTTDRGAVRYRALVVATNAWTHALVPSLAITPHRAQMLATAPLARTLEAPCYARLGFDYFRQLDDGRLLVGGQRDRFAADEATDEMLPTPAVQDALEALVAAHLPFARGAVIERRWAGVMGFTASALPFVGPLSPSLWVNAGFTGHGLGIALGCADLVARRLLGAALPPEAAPLEPALAPSR